VLPKMSMVFISWQNVQALAPLPAGASVETGVRFELRGSTDETAGW